MNKVFRYVVAYFAWIANLILTLWFAYLARTCLTSILALFYKQGDWAYLKAADFTERIFTILLGLGWLAFMILVESFFRNGVAKGDLLQRIARVTGGVALGIFMVDLIMFWLQGAGSAGWLRWLVLAVELGVGMVLVVSAKNRFISKSN